jgi:hypothetical protein
MDDASDSKRHPIFDAGALAVATPRFVKRLVIPVIFSECLNVCASFYSLDSPVDEY